jgi:hypothetical protein
MEHILDVLTVFKSKRPLTVKEAKSRSDDLRALFRAKALHGCERKLPLDTMVACVTNDMIVNQPQDTSDLTFNDGDYLDVLAKASKHYFARDAQGKTGRGYALARSLGSQR